MSVAVLSLEIIISSLLFRFFSENKVVTLVLRYTVEVEIFALKNVCNFSNPANMKFCEQRLFAIFYSV